MNLEEMMKGGWEPINRTNPQKRDDGWYWFDEAGQAFGPIETEEEAQEVLNAYVNNLMDDLGNFPALPGPGEGGVG